MQLIFEKKLADYYKDCEARKMPINLGYVKYLKGRIEREKQESKSFMARLFG